MRAPFLRGPRRALLGRGRADVGGAAAPFSPTDLGASLLAWWPADRADLITQVAGVVSSWKDVVAAYDATATLTAQPTYSATGWNAATSGITFNGIANCLVLTPSPFPTLSTASSRIWARVDQTALVADASARYIAAYGGDTATNQRRLLRRVSGGANIASAQLNTTSGDAPGDFSGRHVVEATWFTGNENCTMDGNQGSNVLVTTTAGSTRFRIGATANLAASAFFQGVLGDVLVTTSLTVGQRASLLAYLTGRL